MEDLLFKLRNDIITYKEDNGIVYGYFNQKAMDYFFFYRAKINSHDFSDKSPYEEDIYKRVIQFDDISVQEHNMPHIVLQDGEFVSEGDVLFDLGLKYYDSYFKENYISDYNTLLYYNVIIFSKYSGYYSSFIHDDTRFGVNMGNTIKDGDLLFSIRPADGPSYIENDIKDVKFDFNMIPRPLLENSWGLCDFKVKSIISANYSYVNKGDDILVVSQSDNYDYYLKSSYNGLLVFSKYLSVLKKGTLICNIYPDVASLKQKFPFIVKVTKDDFTKKAVVNCEMTGKFNWMGTSGFFMGYDIYFNFENVGGKSFLIMEFDMKSIKIDKLCALHLLLDNGYVISLSPASNPIKSNGNYICKFPLSKADMDELEKNKFIKWRITNGEGITLKDGNNICCRDDKDTTNITTELSYEVFQDLIIKFSEKVNENITTDEKEEVENSQKSCYVYLMIDTTNYFYKIGISNRPKYREHTLQSDKPTIELVCAKEYPSRDIAEAIEAALHKVYASKRIRGEWFNLDDTDIDIIKQTLK